MFENRVLRRIFGLRRDEVTGEWRKLHNEENWMGGACSTYAGRGDAYTGFWWGNLREREHMQDPNVDVRIILRWILRKCDVGT